MSHLIVVQFILVLLLNAVSSLAALEISQNTGNFNGKNILPYKEGRVLVKTLYNSPDDALISDANSLGAIKTKSYSIVPGLALYEYDESIDVEDAIQVFLDNAYVEYAEPDFYYHAAAQNDPRFIDLWALNNTGQTGGTVDADINAPLMWQQEEGDPQVVIGVIDTGVNYNHQDLSPNMWRNPSEIAGNGVDDDNNGYVDDVFGINAITNTGNPNDDNAHGSHVAGTIGAKGNNSIGVVGVAQNIRIAACKFLGANGSGAISDAIQCMQYFAALKSRSVNPVNLVATNNSWGGGSRSTAMLEAIRSHQNLGILFVAAAGNASSNNDVGSFYPAKYELPNVIAVAATDHSDRLASFSNFGRRTVHVAAPGVRILSTVLNQGYSFFSGTSMAAPHVSGLIAIIKSHSPALNYKEVKNLVISSGTPISALQGATISGRRIRGADTNGRGALTCNNQSVSSRLTPLNNVSITVGSNLFLSALRINCSAPSGPITLYTSGNQSIVLQDGGVNGDLVAGDGIYSFLWRPQTPGTYALNYGNGDVVTVVVLDLQSYLAINNIAYEYETISGSSLNAGDETVHSVNVPFPIHFGGDDIGFQRLYVSSNGTVSFTYATNPGYVNQTLPTTALSTIVAPYWDDLMATGANSNIFVQAVGTTPNRKFVIEWRNVKHYNASGLGTFQALFYENKPDIRFNYLDTNFGVSTLNYGKSATVGVQNAPNSAAQFSYNQALIPSRKSLLFRLR